MRFDEYFPRQRTVWFVITPAGEAGPFYSRQAAQDEARRFGWVVVPRQIKEER